MSPSGAVCAQLLALAAIAGPRAAVAVIPNVTGFLPDYSECAQYAHCGSCASAWYVANACRWCDKDHRCHEGGSPYNACGYYGGITNASECPAPAPIQTAFDLSVAYDMTLFANAAYFDDISSQPLPDGFKVISQFNYTLGLWNSAHGYLGVDMVRKRAVVAFRGTDAISQLFKELIHHTLVPHPDLPGAFVNEFFLAAVQSLDPFVREALERLRETCSDCTLWFTGHSLGGAMAMMMAHHVMLSSLNLVENRSIVAYTFGQPRMGNAAYANSVDSLLPTYFRVVNAADVVPHVPECDTGKNGSCVQTANGYYHAGTEIWFASGEYRQGVMCGYRECVRKPHSEDHTCSDATISPLAPPDAPDHRGYFAIIPQGFCRNLTSTGGRESNSVILI